MPRRIGEMIFEFSIPIAWAHNCPFPMVVDLNGKPCEPISRLRGLLNRFCHLFKCFQKLLQLVLIIRWNGKLVALYLIRGSFSVSGFGKL